MNNTIANNINVVAKFVPIPQSDPLILTIQKYSLHGTITGDGISCGSAQLSCTKSYTSTTNVTLTALPDTGYQFDGWGVGCSGLQDCSFLVNTNKRVTANLSRAVFKTLSIQKPWDGMITGIGIC